MQSPLLFAKMDGFGPGQVFLSHDSFHWPHDWTRASLITTPSRPCSRITSHIFQACPIPCTFCSSMYLYHCRLVDFLVLAVTTFFPVPKAIMRTKCFGLWVLFLCLFPSKSECCNMLEIMLEIGTRKNGHKGPRFWIGARWICWTNAQGKGERCVMQWKW